MNVHALPVFNNVAFVLLELALWIGAVVAIGFAVYFAQKEGWWHKLRGGLCVLTALVALALAVPPLFTQTMVCSDEVGISKTRAYDTGTMLFPEERVLTFKREGKCTVGSRNAEVSIQIDYRIIYPEKLVPLFEELRGFTSLDQYMDWRFKQFFGDLPVSPEKLDSELGRLTKTLTEAGVAARLTVTRTYVVTTGVSDL